MEAILFNAARADHIDTVIRPAIAAGKAVICDRFYDSTRVYQGVEGKLDAVLSAVPILLLLVVVVVAMGHFHFSLVGIEPFDAFVFRIAGWAAIARAIATRCATSLDSRKIFSRRSSPSPSSSR